VEPFIRAIDGFEPQVEEAAFIAPGAVVLGNVELGRGSSIWYGCVLRGDDERIVLGADCNVQDGSVIHADAGEPSILGDRVSLGHGAIVHAATIEDDVLIGMRAVVLNRAHVGTGSVVAAGAIVRPGMEIPPNSLVAGVPAKVRREAGDAERDMIARTSRQYVQKSERHRKAMDG
jgi:carbonic anhydrase/acetyltransferase-like protein (isoleucine patch superfamily)